MVASCQYCIICHLSFASLTNISPSNLRLKSPILLVSWLPPSEDARVTEIGHEREPLRPECSQSEQETRKHPRSVTQSENMLYKKYSQKNIVSVHTRVIMRTTETLSNGRRPVALSWVLHHNESRAGLWLVRVKRPAASDWLMTTKCRGLMKTHCWQSGWK